MKGRECLLQTWCGDSCEAGGELAAMGREGCRAGYRRLGRQGLLKENQIESVLPTDLVRRGVGECPRLKRNTTLICDVHIHNADRSKGTAEQ